MSQRYCVGPSLREVVVLRAESLLCLGLSPRSRPEPRSKVILLSLREPWPRAWAWLPGQLFRDSSVPAQMPVSLPLFHGAQPAAKMSHCRSLLLVFLVTRISPSLSPSVISILWFHFSVLPLVSLLSHLGTDTQSTVGLFSRDVDFPTSAWPYPSSA